MASKNFVRTCLSIFIVLLTSVGVWKTAEMAGRGAKAQDMQSTDDRADSVSFAKNDRDEVTGICVKTESDTGEKKASEQTRLEEAKPEQARSADTQKNNITLTGVLVATEQWRVGSIAYGVAQKLYFKEEDEVKKGQLLLEIDTAVGDWEVREALAELETAKAQLTYESAFYERQKALYAAHEISKNEFEKNTRDFDVARAQVDLKVASHAKKAKTFAATKIYAPGDGVVIKNNITLGQVATSFAIGDVLLVIANLDMMKAQFEIDEKRRGDVKEGQKIVVHVNAGRSLQCHVHIAEIRPIANGKFIVETQAFDNKKHVLHPGMVVRGVLTPLKPEEREVSFLTAVAEAPERDFTRPSIFAKAEVTQEWAEARR